tara:strand:+ start:13717 stop:14304 length:588 start_codon:yes stop_codon:yes gene_type:complete
MKILKLAAAAAIAAGLSFSASAADESVSTLSILTNDFTSAGYITSENDGNDVDGFTVEFAKQWDNDFYGSLQYAKASGDVMGWNVDTYTLNGVVGKQFAIDAVSVWEVEAGARFAGVKVGGLSDDETFATVAANYRRAFTNQFAMSAGLDYVDGTTSVVIGGEYDFTENFGVAVDYWKNSDENTIMLELVYRPGK